MVIRGGGWRWAEVRGCGELAWGVCGGGSKGGRAQGRPGGWWVWLVFVLANGSIFEPELRVVQHRLLLHQLHAAHASQTHSGVPRGVYRCVNCCCCFSACHSCLIHVSRRPAVPSATQQPGVAVCTNSPYNCSADLYTYSTHHTTVCHGGSIGVYHPLQQQGAPHSCGHHPLAPHVHVPRTARPSPAAAGEGWKYSEVAAGPS